MAVGRHDPTRKTIYLDQSTISDAFLATEGRSNSDAGYAPLRDWIDRVAHEANLCLSTAHLVEVARFPEIVTGDRIVLWLDSLPTVWVRPADDIAEDEDEVWTKFAAGIAPTQAVQAFTDNPINAFRTLRTNLQALAVAATTDGTIYPFVNAARHLDLSAHAAMMATIVRAAGEDAREATAAGWTNDMKARKVAYNLRVALRQASWNAVARINARSDPDLGGRELSVNVVDDFVALFEKEPKSLPATRVRHALASHWAKGFRVKTSIKPDELLGDFFDYRSCKVSCVR